MPDPVSLPPMVAIVERKHHGKTTLAVPLATELHRRGHRVMTIKHGTHTFNIDPATTDTYRHFHEGLAEKVTLVSPAPPFPTSRSSVRPPARRRCTTPRPTRRGTISPSRATPPTSPPRYP